MDHKYELLKTRGDLLFLIKYTAKRARLWQQRCPREGLLAMGSRQVVSTTVHAELLILVKELTSIFRMGGPRHGTPT